MNKEELEVLLGDLDQELASTFPGPEPICLLVVGGACLLLAGVSARPTKDIDVIITDLFGSGQASLVFELNKTTRTIRTLIQRVGKRYGLRGKEAHFLNDDCMPFLLEMGGLPPMTLLAAYTKLHLFLPPLVIWRKICQDFRGLTPGSPTSSPRPTPLTTRRRPRALHLCLDCPATQGHPYPSRSKCSAVLLIPFSVSQLAKVLSKWYSLESVQEHLVPEAPGVAEFVKKRYLLSV